MAISFVGRDDGRIAYEVHGRGPLVVLAHGMGENRHSYRHLIPLLVDAGYRVASVDVRGHGDSSAGWPSYAPAEVGGDLLAVVRDLGDGPAVLVGNSSSAAAVVFAATEAPERVGGIVLVGAFVEQRKLNPLIWLAQAAVLRSPRLFGMFHRTLFPVHRPADDAEYRKQMVTALRRPGRMAPVRGVIVPVQPHWTAQAPLVRQPVLVLMGSKDPDFPDPPAEARAARRLFEVAEARMIADAGHYPHADRPAAMLAELVDFLAVTDRA
ncbi:Lysophospholipase, alpha-beta hydrolase superfamily [Micromonospora phaseoli]|uniref:Lysophospholipase, alpha-beta hydrolase superfamily n=1 Tax=Micromonospora phaseoli TaxID=1144548 RepID=A0A1H6XDL2_9ACTN|nr:alpha/beta hydrolase [Micromonospora phaseoli]PZW02212.1 alpha-beta hydrolase superfamily lysophospholipase [Micromonospora phaseoli]GIJ75786.1 hydrolase [Micromonospora phaseoli]SEJ27251.1 Lysophospholipase, alpha-beta hydrolase superfamily [Micromonospora phaseoli]